MLRARLALTVGFFAAFCGGLLACGSQTPEATAPPAPKADPPSEPEGIPPTGHIDRHELDRILAQGPGWFFERVPIEEVTRKRKFIGWRLRDLPDSWVEADVRPGDVVTAVNGMPVERPEQFWAAWTTLAVASELKVAILRDGKPEVLSFPIWGSPDGKSAPAADAKGPPRPAARPKAGPRRKPTIVIRGDQPPASSWSNW